MGTCSVISSVYGPRVALWNFGKGAILLKETNQTGITPQNLKSVAQSHYQIAIMNQDCEIKRIYVPLHLGMESTCLTLIREFLGPSPSAFSGKKSRIIAGDVTVGTLKMRMICADRVSVGLSYDTNFKWHMPI